MTSPTVPPARSRPTVETAPAKVPVDESASPGVARRTAGGSDLPLSMRVSRPGGRVVVLAVHGAVDAASQPRLAELLRERLDSFAARVVLDLSAVSFFNSEAVMTLLDAAHHARVRAKPFTVISSPAVDRVVGLLAVDDRVCWASTWADAVPAPPEAASPRSAAEP